MKKTLLTLVAIMVVVAIMLTCFVGCDNTTTNTDNGQTNNGTNSGDNSGNTTALSLSNIKVGLICLHDKSSTYDKNFIVAMEEVQRELGLSNEQVIIKTGIPEGVECFNAAEEMVAAGCNVIIADSFGHEAYMIQAAKKYPNTLFCHATGTKAHTEKLPNYVNAFASIYEGRYLAGVVAGMKLKEMLDAGTVTSAKVGYIGAFTYAEVISGYTSWFLGVRSIVPTATMAVTFTGSWYDETAENNAAKKLINDNGCVLISQHADSMGAPNACEEAGVPNVSYNGSTYDACPDTFLVSSRINWAPYYKYVIESKIAGKTTAEIGYDYVGTIATGSVQLTALGDAVAAGTQAKLDEVKAGLADGSIKVFATNTFTVTTRNGDVETSAPLTTYLADVDDMGDYQGETEVIANGEFQESKFRSAPYFDLDIDGITLLDRNYGD